MSDNLNDTVSGLKMINNTLEAYDNWGNVTDYESDETTVTLIDKDGKKLAEFNYPKFTADDFERYFSTCRTN